MVTLGIMANVIKKNLQKCGIKTANELATIMGAAPSTVFQWLNGNPKLSTIQKIAEAINVPASVLLQDDEQNNTNTNRIEFRCSCGKCHVITLKFD